MPRKLSAIEIAEGALLADIAVIFQLLSLYLPIGKSFLRILIPIVFTIILFTLMAGLPLTSLIKPIHVTYASFIATINFIASHIGLGNFWQQNVYPIVNFIANLAFTYWLAFWYVFIWLFLWSVVIVIY